MRMKSAWISAALVVICLTGGIQRKNFIGSLRTSDGGVFAAREGRLVLERGQNGIAPKVSPTLSVWHLGSPYLSCQEKFLSIDQTEAGVRVYLTTEKTESAKWVIEVLETKSPKTPPKEDRRLKEGRSETKFRLSIFEGRYKGWYLAAKEPTEKKVDEQAGAPTVIEFHAVKDPKQALTFDYVDSSYSITHK